MVRWWGYIYINNYNIYNNIYMYLFYKVLVKNTSLTSPRFKYSNTNVYIDYDIKISGEVCPTQ